MSVGVGLRLWDNVLPYFELGWLDSRAVAGLGLRSTLATVIFLRAAAADSTIIRPASGQPFASVCQSFFRES